MLFGGARSTARTLAIVGALSSLGCGTRRQTGDALVATGAVVAYAASEMATRGQPYPPNCVGCVRHGSTSKYGPQAAAGVAAGVALAVAGYALRRSDEPSDAIPPRTRPAYASSKNESSEGTAAEEQSSESESPDPR